MPSDCGSTTAAMAMNTAARPIMLCMKATSSGILVISTRLAMIEPAVPPTSRPRITKPRPWVASSLPSLYTRPTVVTMAMPMPTMPNRLPRRELVGWDRPFSAWMKQIEAIR
ncbi:hypothetical protein D9M68_966340 [compost metagenome]